MWKIEIKEEHNPGSPYAGKWFNGFDESNQPTFVENRASAFVMNDTEELAKTIIRLNNEFSLVSYWFNN